jgi:hypothetical protein
MELYMLSYIAKEVPLLIINSRYFSYLSGCESLRILKFKLNAEGFLIRKNIINK